MASRVLAVTQAQEVYQGWLAKWARLVLSGHGEFAAIPDR
jgi:hypothetical protein